MLRFGKWLGGEIYVASEPGATPAQNYAPIDRTSRRVDRPVRYDPFGQQASIFRIMPQATFGAPSALHCLGLLEFRCYPLVGFAITSSSKAARAVARNRTKHLISGGFSS
jgi:hypothetical protein